MPLTSAVIVEGGLNTEFTEGTEDQESGGRAEQEDAWGVLETEMDARLLDGGVFWKDICVGSEKT